MKLDSHIVLAFAGLTADARVLIDRARIECQSYRLTQEDPCSIEYISRFIGQLQQVLHLHFLMMLSCLAHFCATAVSLSLSQKYTQTGGRRPFGVSTLICGFDPADKTPKLFHTDPSGTFWSWKVCLCRCCSPVLNINGLFTFCPTEGKCNWSWRENCSRISRKKL